MDNNVLQKLIVSPSQLKLTDTLSTLGREYPSLAGDQLLQLMEEVQKAQEQIQHALAEYQLELFFTESVNEIQENAS
jgi:hypothetical protein